MAFYKGLNPILHSQLRLAIISILISTEVAEFTFIQEKTGASAGNLSVQISKLKEAGYITVEKKFSKNYPKTLCRITKSGREQFTKYVNDISKYLNPE